MRLGRLLRSGRFLYPVTVMRILRLLIPLGPAGALAVAVTRIVGRRWRLSAVLIRFLVALVSASFRCATCLAWSVRVRVRRPLAVTTVRQLDTQLTVTLTPPWCRTRWRRAILSVSRGAASRRLGSGAGGAGAGGGRAGPGRARPRGGVTV